MHHYTDKSGYDCIRSNPTWKFVAGRPPGDHPFGAYFTTLDPHTPKLAKRLLIPKDKLSYRFEFTGSDGLKPLPGGRGGFIFFSESDYVVVRHRQIFLGETGL